MPRNEFLKNLQDADSSIFRYFLYLSRNNRWVRIGDDVFQLKIKQLTKDSVPCEAGEDELKLFLSQKEFSRTVLASSSYGEYYDDNSEILSRLNLSIVVQNYRRLAVSYYEINKRKPDYLECESIAICFEAENFDAVFAKNIDAMKTVEEKTQSIADYQEKKHLAVEEATKNPIWLAAASGDHKLLMELLKETKAYDFNSTYYRGKTILKAMLEATTENTPAFKYIIPKRNNKLDYAETLDLLIINGLNEGTMQQFYDACVSSNQDSNLYPKPATDPNGILPLIKARLSAQVRQQNESEALSNNNLEILKS